MRRKQPLTISEYLMQLRFAAKAFWWDFWLAMRELMIQRASDHMLANFDWDAYYYNPNAYVHWSDMAKAELKKRGWILIQDAPLDKPQWYRNGETL